MNSFSYKLGKDCEQWLSVYFMKNSVEISSHEFDDYDSCVNTIKISYEMFEKLADTIKFYNLAKGNMKNEQEE